MVAARLLRLSVGRHDLPISQHPVWEIPQLCPYRPQTRACRLEVKGGRGQGGMQGRQGNRPSREGRPLTSSASVPSFGTNPVFLCRPILCHDDASGCASDRITKDYCTPDTPLFPVCAGDLVLGAGDPGRALFGGAQEREGFLEWEPGS